MFERSSPLRDSLISSKKASPDSYSVEIPSMDAPDTGNISLTASGKFWTNFSIERASSNNPCRQLPDQPACEQIGNLNGNKGRKRWQTLAF